MESSIEPKVAVPSNDRIASLPSGATISTTMSAGCGVLDSDLAADTKGIGAGVIARDAGCFLEPIGRPLLLPVFRRGLTTVLSAVRVAPRGFTE